MVANMPPTVRAYPVTTSCIAGQPIEIVLASMDVALDPGKQYYLRIVNMGTDNEVGSRILLTTADVAVVPVQVSRSAENGFNWPTRKTVPTSADWRSCLYCAEVLEDKDPIPGSRAFFVVRNALPGQLNKIIIHWPFATYHAYGGSWGDRGCLYDSTQQLRGRRVTTQRSIDGVTDGLSNGASGKDQGVALWRWLDSKTAKYHADACSSWDLHSDSSTLKDYRILVLAGHDEYWSKEMRDHVEAFVSSGGHVANLSGNAAWWQIRYSTDGGSITCYKNVLEDPLLGIDNSRVTCNWATDPPNRPENSLTGLSFRYGWPMGGPVRVVPHVPAEAAPLWSGVVHPEKLGNLGGEVDGIELDFSDLSNPKPTYRDGTPDTFTLLAYNDPVSGDGPERHVVVGYFTNVGTVLSCPAIDWIDHLSDADVSTFTSNVFDWLLSRSNGPAMGPSASKTPPNDWEMVGVGTFTALAASFQGRVYAASRALMFARHLDMASDWESVAMPGDFTSVITALATDLYGYTVMAGGNNQIAILTASGKTLSPNSVAPVVGISEHFAGLACSDTTGGTDAGGGACYALVGADQSSLELRVLTRNVWYQIGDGSGLRTITGCDGYILASTTDNRLVARMGGILGVAPDPNALVCDTTWIDIGAAPDVFVLAHSFGRLYALSGTHQNSKFMWRSLRPDADRLPLEHGRLLFYNDQTGDCVFGIFRANGDYEEQGGFMAGGGWTHVTRINDGLIFFYNSGNGDALVGRVNADATWSELRRSAGEFSTWSIVVSDGAYVLFYGPDGSGAIGRMDPTTGIFTATEYRGGFSPSWTLAASTWGIAAPRLAGRGKYLIFYAGDGNVAIGEISGSGKFRSLGSGRLMAGADHLIPVGQLGIFAYDSKSGTGEYGEISVSDSPAYKAIQSWTTFARGWILGAGRNGLALFYSAENASAIAGGFCRAGIFQPLNTWASDDGGFLSGWSHIVGI